MNWEEEISVVPLFSSPMEAAVEGRSKPKPQKLSVRKRNPPPVTSSEKNALGLGLSHTLADRIGVPDPFRLVKATGLENNDQSTCYMNSVVQCLSRDPSFANHAANYFFSHKCNSDLCVPLCTLKFYKSLMLVPHGSKENPSRIFDFPSWCTNFFSSLTKGNQEDAEAFLLHLLNFMDALGGENVGEKNQKGAGYEFQGWTTKESFCPGCLKADEMREAFWDIHLPFIKRSTSIEDVVTEHFRVKDMDEARCLSCQLKKKEKLIIDTMPPVLILHLPKFGNGGEPRDEGIKFPLQLDFSNFTSDKRDSATYEINALIVHEGEQLKEGHYLSYVRHNAHTWFEFDDTRVKQVDVNVVLSKEPYLLFLARSGSQSFEDYQKSVVACEFASMVLDNTKLHLLYMERLYFFASLMNEPPWLLEQCTHMAEACEKADRANKEKIDFLLQTQIFYDMFKKVVDLEGSGKAPTQEIVIADQTGVGYQQPHKPSRPWTESEVREPTENVDKSVDTHATTDGQTREGVTTVGKQLPHKPFVPWTEEELQELVESVDRCANTQKKKNWAVIRKDFPKSKREERAFNDKWSKMKFAALKGTNKFSKEIALGVLRVEQKLDPKNELINKRLDELSG